MKWDHQDIADRFSDGEDGTEGEPLKEEFIATAERILSELKGIVNMNLREELEGGVAEALLEAFQSGLKKALLIVQGVDSDFKKGRVAPGLVVPRICRLIDEERRPI